MRNRRLSETAATCAHILSSEQQQVHSLAPESTVEHHICGCVIGTRSETHALAECAAVKAVSQQVLRGVGLHHRLEDVLQPDAFAAWTACVEDAWLASPTLHPLIISELIKRARRLLEACDECERRDEALTLVDSWEQLHEDTVVCSETDAHMCMFLGWGGGG